MHEVLIHNPLSHQEEECAPKETASTWSATFVDESSLPMDSLSTL
jgi:hypothetical protein